MHECFFSTLINNSLKKIVLFNLFYVKNTIFHSSFTINSPSSSSMSGIYFIGCNSCTSFHDPFLVTVRLRDAFDPVLRMYSETIERKIMFNFFCFHFINRVVRYGKFFIHYAIKLDGRYCTLKDNIS